MADLGQILEDQYPLSLIPSDSLTQFNLDKGLAAWRNKLKLNTGTLNINFEGDSITEGTGATPDARTGGFVNLLRQSFNTLYGNVGEGFIPPNYPKDDEVITFTGFNNGTGFGVTGQGFNTNTPGDKAEWSFTGDGLEVFISRASVAGEYKLFVDEVLIDTHDTQFSGTIHQDSVIYSGLGSGAHTARFERFTGFVYFWGFREIQGSVGISCNMCARFGIKATSADSDPSRESTEYLNPDLSVIAFVANDSNNQTVLATYVSELETIIVSAKTTGDVLILVNGLHSTETSPISERKYGNALAVLASAHNCAIIDINRYWGDDGPTTQDLGFFDDDVHPSDKGHIFHKDRLFPIITGNW